MAGPNFLGLGALQIDSSSASYFLNGNVGIGTTSPSGAGIRLGGQTAFGKILHLEVGDLNAVRLRHPVYGLDSGIYQEFDRGAFFATFGTSSNHDASIKTNNTERVTVSAGGNVGIGKTSPAAKLDVNGDVRASNEIKVWDSGWFAITANQAIDFNHNLGALPKGVTVYCGNNVTPVPGNPSIANSLFVDTTGAANELGCYIARVTTTSLRVRARSKIGINEADNGVLTSGAYRIIAWT